MKTVEKATFPKSEFGACAWRNIRAEAPKGERVVFKSVRRFKQAPKEHTPDLVKELNRPKKLITGRGRPGHGLRQ